MFNVDCCCGHKQLSNKNPNFSLSTFTNENVQLDCLWIITLLFRIYNTVFMVCYKLKCFVTHCCSLAVL